MKKYLIGFIVGITITVLLLFAFFKYNREITIQNAELITPQNKQEELGIACFEGDVAKIKSLLVANPELREEFFNKNTPVTPGSRLLSIFARVGFFKKITYPWTEWPAEACLEGIVYRLIGAASLTDYMEQRQKAKAPAALLTPDQQGSVAEQWLKMLHEIGITVDWQKPEGLFFQARIGSLGTSAIDVFIKDPYFTSLKNEQFAFGKEGKNKGSYLDYLIDQHGWGIAYYLLEHQAIEPSVATLRYALNQAAIDLKNPKLQSFTEAILMTLRLILKNLANKKMLPSEISLQADVPPKIAELLKEFGVLFWELVGGWSEHGDSEKKGK